DPRVSRAFRDHRDLKVLRVKLVQPDHKARPDLLDPKDHRGQRVHLDPSAPKAKKDPPVRKDPPASTATPSITELAHLAQRSASTATSTSTQAPPPFTDPNPVVRGAPAPASSAR